MPILGEVNAGTATEQEFEWKIPDFLSNVKENCSSPEFSFAAASWQFCIYTNTGENAKQEYIRYISLFLGRNDDDPPISLEVSLGFKTSNGLKFCERKFTQPCIADSDLEAYGKNRFLWRTQLLKKESELLPSGVLTVFCKMKDLKSTEEASDIGSSGSSVVPHDNKALHDFKEMFFNEEDCDVVINIKGQEFSAHRLILKARSPVFAATFRNDMKEKATGVVDIEDCDPFSFSDFLCFLYCADTRVISEENVFSLFTAADKYDVKDLRVKCLEFMKKNITVDAFCDSITFALQHSEKELVKLTTRFFIKNAPKIIRTDKWKSFLAENPAQSNELLVKLLPSDKSLSK